MIYFDEYYFIYCDDEENNFGLDYDYEYYENEDNYFELEDYFNS